MPGAQQTAADIGTHPSQTDHAQLHGSTPRQNATSVVKIPRRQAPIPAAIARRKTPTRIGADYPGAVQNAA
jgi:hypothetical protein